MRRALRGAPVAAVLSEEIALPEILNSEAPLCVAIDPLDDRPTWKIISPLAPSFDPSSGK
jgi:hypothetical protein